jgi:tetratricopeptide (TPR) repeat protein
MTRKPKKLTNEAVLGAAGVGLIQLVVAKMGHNFYPYGQPEVGIDGAIELREPETNAMTGRLVFVQSKAHEGAFDDETDTGFTYTARQRDLDYWMDVSGPVLLVVSRPDTDEAYWVPVQEFFADPVRRESRVATFDKQVDGFTREASQALFDVFRRDEARRAERLQSLVYGPLTVLGLEDRLDAARQAQNRGDAAAAAAVWQELADAVGQRLDPPFVWPLLENTARALLASGDGQAASATYVRLAKERLDADDPAAHFDVQRAFFAAGGVADFELALLSARVAAPEQGVESLGPLRELRKQARNAEQRRAATSALVDALVLYGLWGEAVAATSGIALKRLYSPEKRGLLADRCDAAGELGEDTEEDWQRLLAAAEDAGPWHFGQALQRRGAFLARRGEVRAAEQAYRRAADLWARVPGADEQASEALMSMEVCGGMSGQLRSPLPFGTRAAMALARGVALVPAVRADRLALNGLALLADGQYPDALQNLTMALMVERRAGDLFGFRRMLVFLGRACEAVDEPFEAMRWWIRAGDERRAETTAKGLTFETIRPLLQLDAGRPWERSASFAALASIAKDLSADEVGEIAHATIEAAKPRPGVVAPQPSFQARKLLTAIAEHLPQSELAAAEAIFKEEVTIEGFSAGPAAIALAQLTQRGAIDALPFILRMVLAGRDMPISAAPFLKAASRRRQHTVAKAALAGNNVALGEAARADLPTVFPELVPLCRARVRAAVENERRDAEVEFIGMSFGDLGDLGRHCPGPTQRTLVDMLLDAVASHRYDSISKTSALITLATLAPGLAEMTTARRALAALLPLACGEPPGGRTGVQSDHPNLKRARNILNWGDGGTQLQVTALQTCGRLAARATPTSPELAALFDSVFFENVEELVRMALRELIGLPDLPVTFDIEPLARDPRPQVAAAALALSHQREHGTPGDYE